MKIAFTTSGNDLNSALDKRFGRAEKFLIYDVESTHFQVIDNQQNLNAAQGAGIQAAEIIVRAGANCVITGHCGPKAFRALTTAKVQIFNTNASTISEALEQFRSGKLTPAASADVEGHW
jgi:predicted Fe-Mo cluster-binding NifX family protein